MENQIESQNCQHCPPGTMPYAIKQGDTFFRWLPDSELPLMQ